MIRLKLFICLLFLFSFSGYSQNLYVKIECKNSSPEIGERVLINYKLLLKNGSFSHSGSIEVKRSIPEGLKLLDEGKGSGFDFGGGFGSMEMTVQKYQMLVQPKKTGKITIPPVEFILGDKRIKSEAFVLEVRKAGSKAQIPQNKNLFLQISLDKRRVFVGEKLIATYKLYSRYQSFEVSESKMPSYEGFWSQELKMDQTESMETIKGMRYRVITFKKDLLYAQRAGNFELEPLILEFIINPYSFRRTKEKTVSNSPKIEVLPLPSGKPESFNGAVGKFEFNGKLNQKELKANEAISLELVVSGTGNLNLIELSKPDFPEDFEVYEPKIKDKMSISASGYKGSRTFEYLIIPRTSGEFELGPFSFSYFDPKTKGYQNLESSSFPLNIEKGDQKENAFYQGKQEVLTLEEDIRYLKQNTKLRPKNQYFMNSVWYWVLLLLPLMAAPVYLLVEKVKAKEASLEGKRKKAAKQAIKALDQARNTSKQSGDKEFFDALLKTIYHYLGVKLELAPSQINKEKIADKLRGKGLSEVEISGLLRLLDQAEMARYTSMQEGSIEKLHGESKVLIDKIEGLVK